MGDDPYDFEIAIPSGANAPNYPGTGSKSKNFRRADSDDDEEDEESDDYEDEESMSNDETGSSLGPSLSGSQHTLDKRKPAATTAKTTSLGASRLAPTTGTGSSALDKAKSFLSKYSAQSAKSTGATAASTRPKRVELSMDDDEFSLDSSGEERQKPKKTLSSEKPNSAISTQIPGSNKPSYQVPSLVQSTVPDKETEHFELLCAEATKGPDFASSTPVRRHLPRSMPSNHHLTSENSNKSSDDDEDPRMTTVQMGKEKAKPSGMVTSTSNVREQSEGYESDDVESIASQSDFVDSVETSPRKETLPSVKRARQPSIASESGIYEDEGFEEDAGSTNAHNEPELPTSMTPIPTNPVAETPTSVAPSSSENPSARLYSESNFDYSMDFADDGEELESRANNIDPTATNLQRKKAEAESASDSSAARDRSQESAYLSDSGDHEDNPIGDDTRVSPSTARADLDEQNKDDPVESANPPDSLSSCTEVHTPRLDLVSLSEARQEMNRLNDASPVSHTLSQPPQQQVACGAINPAVLKVSDNPVSSITAQQTVTRVQSSAQEATKGKEAQSPRDNHSLTTTTRRIVIVREYEQANGPVQMKDASTQYTGNHASVQTELVPSGMQNLEQRSAHAPNEPSAEMSKPIEMSHAPTEPTVRYQQPPPPPLPSAYGLYDPLQLPPKESLSNYKQQLLALQQQIQLKKRENEKIFRDRIAFRYSSSRETEQFLSVHRPPEIPLWQALLRVDPSLGENKAREVARLVNENPV